MASRVDEVAAGVSRGDAPGEPEQKVRRSQEERARLTRASIAQAAFESIRDHGYASLRMASVATAAGVSSGALTHHFPSKESITLAAIDHALDQARAKTRANLERFERDASADVVVAFIRECTDYYFSPSFDVAMDVVKSASAMPDLRREIGRMHREYRAFVEDRWLEELTANGWSESQARDLVALTASLIRGFAIRSMIRPDKAEFERLMRLWCEIVRGHFGNG